MIRIFFAILFGTMAFNLPAVAADGKKPPSGSVSVHGASGKGSSRPFIDTFQEQKLANYPSRTIGDAFGNYLYFSKVEWKESPVSGKTYIDFSGTLKQSVLSVMLFKGDTVIRTLEVKFVVYNDSGRYGLVMVTLAERKRDGTLKRTHLEDIGGIVAKIYANSEIKF